jgi:hypothetical protein
MGKFNLYARKIRYDLIRSNQNDEILWILEDHQLSKALIRLLFKLSSKIGNHAPLLRKVAMDIHGQCEDVSEDVNLFFFQI